MKFSLQNLPDAPKILTIITTVLVLISIPVAIILVSQRQEIRKKAAGEPDVTTCIVEGNRYDSDTIRVINNTGVSTTHTIHRRYCIYQGESIPLPDGYECNAWEDPQAGDEVVVVPAGGDQTYSINVPDCKVGQIDITNCKCFDLTCSQDWSGAMAYAIKANSTGYDYNLGICPSSTTPTPSPTLTLSPTPTTPPGVTYTPTPIVPSRTPTPSFTPTPTTPPSATATPTVPPGATYTPTPIPPVSGGIIPTVATIIGGIVLILVGFLL